MSSAPPPFSLGVFLLFNPCEGVYVSGGNFFLTPPPNTQDNLVPLEIISLFSAFLSV